MKYFTTLFYALGLAQKFINFLNTTDKLCAVHNTNDKASNTATEVCDYDQQYARSM